MTGEPVVEVPIEAGLWAVALVVLVVLIVLAALRPVLRRRRKEAPVPCSAPGSLGAHPLGDPDPAGVRRCACGIRASIPAGRSAQLGDLAVTVDPAHVGTPVDVLARTDTREHRWPGDTAELIELRPRRVDPEADTEEAPLPHVVWPSA